MALAKYTEDIIDRYSEDNWERINALFSTRDFDKEWAERSRIESAAVVAKTKGLYFEDRMVFLRSKKVIFSVLCASENLNVTVTFTAHGEDPIRLLPDSKNTYSIPHLKTDGLLQLQCGFYTKTYSIGFLESEKPEALPDVHKVLSNVIKNPAQWTADGFEDVRSQLDACLSQPSIPPTFAAGVKEFYLGLYHENLGERNFRKRLETAFNFLRAYCPYSDYAKLICTYYFYRVNCFDRVAQLHEIPVLSKVANFFKTPFDRLERDLSNDANDACASVEILVSNRDHAMIRAIQSYSMDDYAGSEAILKTLEPVNVGLDPQGDERLELIRARLARRGGRKADTRRAYGKLQDSATASLRDEATEFLTSLL